MVDTRENISFKMERWKLFLLWASLATFHTAHGCAMDGVDFDIPQSAQTYDYFIGVIFQRSTSDIAEITNVQFSESIKGGPYFDVALNEDGEFTISTNNAFTQYEEYETALTLGITVTLRCAPPQNLARTLVVTVTIIDTNNNAPQFLPTDFYEVTLAPPLPPQYEITGCLIDITVRDIDLTTSRIIFALTEESELFEIDFDEENTIPHSKEFKAVLRAKSFIRSLPEAIDLVISATDVDETGNAALTSYATVRIEGDAEFKLPEEPVFSKPYYLAEYTTANTIMLEETISLREGYHEDVNFSLEGEFSTGFNLLKTDNENVLNLVVDTPLSADLLRDQQIILVIKAEREYTSGATATIIVELPQVPGLEFQELNYESNIVDNTLVPLQLRLSEGYEDDYEISISSEYASYFTATPQNDIITLTMTPLDAMIVEENNFINLVITASNQYSTASATVTLGIIKDDTVTPAFEKAIYVGSYDAGTGLTLQEITLEQGYDETVTYELEGEHRSFFQLSGIGPVIIITLTSLNIPTAILAEQQILLTVRASKPRTVGATAVISIELPPARDLSFENPTYIGVLQNNNLTLDVISLSVGYDDDVRFRLTGDYASNFLVTNVDNQITITLSTPLPENAILDNNFLTLTLTATGEHAVAASATILLEILKQDVSTPIFEQKIYYGKYEDGPNVNLENIRLLQGYDSTVSFRIDGEYSEHFTTNINGNNVELLLQSEIPEELIYSEKILLLEIIADKPLTIGANAVILIQFPTDKTEPSVMQFSKNTYLGSIENEQLSLESEVILEFGFATSTTFSLIGEFSTFFALSSNGNVLKIEMSNTLPQEILDSNNFLVLEVTAERERAVPTTASVIVELKQPPVEIPIFNKAFYTAVYTENDGFEFSDVITLSQGYDETVIFALDGEFSTLFTLTQNGNIVTLNVDGIIPEEILANNRHLLFSIVASKTNTVDAVAAIYIDLPKEVQDPLVLQFEDRSYVGSIERGTLNPLIITLSENYEVEPQFIVHGEFSEIFVLDRNEETITVTMSNPLPEEVVEVNVFIKIDIEAKHSEFISGFTTIIIELIKDPKTITPVFRDAYYVGEYSKETGLIFGNVIQLIDGFDDTVTFSLEGTDSDLFELTNINANSFSMKLKSDEPLETEDRSPLVFSIIASKPETVGAKSAIIITNTDLVTTRTLRFSKNYYAGSVNDGNLVMEEIGPLEGYSTGTSILLTGNYAEFFQLSLENDIFTLSLSTELPSEAIGSNNIILLILQAEIYNTKTHATIIIEVIKEVKASLVFDEIYYTGLYSESNGLVLAPEIIVTNGYEDSVSFALEGENAQWFDINANGNSVSLTVPVPIPQEVVVNNQQLIFIITAQKLNTESRSATIVISLENDINTELILGFEKVSYIGTVDDERLNLQPIVLSEGFNDQVTFELTGDLASYFTFSTEGAIVTLTLQNIIPDNVVPSNGIIMLELQASAPQTVSAYAVIVIEVERAISPMPQLLFSNAFYSGKYVNEDLIFDQVITLSEGYDETVEFHIEGDSSVYFRLQITNNIVTLVLNSPIPESVIDSNKNLVFVIVAEKPNHISAQAVIVVSLDKDEQPNSEASFDKVLYEGQIANTDVRHESIILTGYDGTEIQVLGKYAEFFKASHTEGTVLVEVIGPLPLDDDDKYVVLELNGGGAGTVLLLTIIESEPPVVSFSSPSYELQANSAYVGILGHVSATADNNEELIYSLLIDNAHLLQRLSVSSEGELRLSAPVDIGEYNLQAVATTRFTQVTGAAQVILTIKAPETDEEDSITLAPLRVIEIEEEQKYSLISEQFQDCRYTLTARWPVDQSWLYVDEFGLHTVEIDREHPSIAYMALSQIQVELILECDNDESLARQKRSTDTLIPYDYGDSKWVLTESIPYNPRRTIVNVIVNDINDNAPIFEGSEKEPVVVGYPIPELEQKVLPHALIQLKATDADIGLNALLRYSSEEDILAVSPSTGYVHVRNSALLQNDLKLTVKATDRDGAADGLTGSLDLLVKLLDVNQIAVLTVNNAFLDDESTIVSNLSTALEYEVKVLRSTVISDNDEVNVDRNSRKKRNASNTDGAIMLVYVYGLIEQEPVEVRRLTEDINNVAIASVSIVNTVSLEDHLNALEICNTTGLLVATIVLAVLLFIVIIAVTICFILRWRKNRNYDNLSDTSTLESHDGQTAQSKPQPIDVSASINKPRLNIEDLRRSEKRLQERLEAPVGEDAPMPKAATLKEPSIESVINISMPDPQIPIVIQSIDKLKSPDVESDSEDEYGERTKSRRKSVVTFNENVEKIIHVEDNFDDTDSLPDYGVYKL